MQNIRDMKLFYLYMQYSCAIEYLSIHIYMHRAAIAPAAHGSTGESQDWRFMFFKYLLNSLEQRLFSIIHLDDLQ